jgi:transposase-like protein
MHKTEKKGAPKRGGKQFNYDFSFMRKVVKDYVEGDQSVKSVSLRYGITYFSLKSWVERYGKGLAPFESISLISMAESSPSTDLTELERQHRELLSKLEAASLKIAGLETMIDIAEEELGVDIRKKSGTKQS